MSSWGSTESGHKQWALAVKRRDRYRCQRCGYQGRPGSRDIQADHIVNRAAGGGYTLSNGQALCIPCHDLKTAGEQAAGRARVSRYRQGEVHPGMRA